MKRCQTCIYWDNEWFGHCSNSKVSFFIKSWCPQDLPNWIHIKILQVFETPEDFGCVLHEQK